MNKEANMERLEVFDFIIEREGNIQIRDRDRLCMRGNGFEKSGADYHYYTFGDLRQKHCPRTSPFAVSKEQCSVVSSQIPAGL